MNSEIKSSELETLLGRILTQPNQQFKDILETIGIGNN